MVQAFLTAAREFLPLLATLAGVLGVLAVTHFLLRRRWRDQPEAQFRFQLIMLALTVAGVLAVILALPISDTLQSQLLSLIGILLSAAIALSSATFIGNILAGIMLKGVGSARPGDFITVADLTGRITEMDLLHTEIQTEFRDLVTVPNMYMVTQPLKVVRASGSIITAEVSLGYDVSHNRAADVLREAAESTGLTDCFVHLRSLGDFSVTYRVAGLLEDIESLISARSALLEAMLDGLHGSGIEIVSPNFMNTRAVDPVQPVMPPKESGAAKPARPRVHAEDVAFDKAEEAASVEKLRSAIEDVDLELAALKEGGEQDGTKAVQLTARRQYLSAELDRGLAHLKAKEQE